MSDIRDPNYVPTTAEASANPAGFVEGMAEVTAPAKPTISESTQDACDIATGRKSAPNSDGVTIVGAKKDLNCKGNGPQWYRMVYRSGSWQYVSDERLPNGNYLASDRRATVSGEVYHGEIIVSHDRGSPVDAAWLARRPKPDGDGKWLIALPCPTKRRDSRLVFTLPDGGVIDLPDPRKK